MKRYNNLWDKICNKENFLEAYKSAIKGKGFYTDVKRIEKIGRKKYLNYLLKQVKNGEYEVSKYKVYNKYTGGKLREIWKLPMKDRIVQHAIMRVIEPIFRETFIVDTFSSIKGRGIHAGLKRVKRALRINDYKYCLTLDIKKCYPSLDKDILKVKLAKKFKDKRLLSLLYKIIDSCDKGVPIGNYTSQYFNNFYFSDFDHWIKEVKKVKAYFRYCDDIKILSNNKNDLRNLYREISYFMDTLHVSLKGNYQITNIKIKSVDFLGYKIRKDYTLIRCHTKRRFIRKVSSMDLNNLDSRDANVLGSYWGIFTHGDCRNLWFKYLKVKSFKDLKIEVHKRDFVRNLIGVPLVITNSFIYSKRGVDWLRFECNYKINGKDNKVIEVNDVLVNTSGEMLVEAGKKFNKSSYPFETSIIVDDKGFYKFI